VSAPFMQLYVADYLGDTRHLTTEQHGAYLLLLMTMWRSDGRLPNDQKKLARIAGCSTSRWAKISSEVLEFFDAGEDGLTNVRLSRELEKASEKSIKRAVSGSLGGEAKALKTKEAKVAIATSLLKHSSEPDSELDKKDSTTTSCAPDLVDWKNRIEEAKFLAGDMADLTRPAMHHAADLRAVVEPVSGEPCTWEEVLDAIAMVAMRQRAKGRKIASWKWVQSDALALRDKRLSAINPEVAETSPIRSTGPPTSLTDQIAANNAESRRRAFELLDAENGRTN
jgi:uncharacterized protein YdaU (DUF1376 family)